ncbi:MAG TPA: 23S rRNA (uracil(1939)-C(5))-methyltransferase RlmD [Peptococcaceae bacterium]|nr:23S rRNA (uracil(1939)-C(5))-methyltransferase RlmD [Peptococcaceae bacterium]
MKEFIMRCLIDGITHRGEGVARINEKVAFIPFTIPGEEVEVEIVDERARFSRGKITQIVAPSPERAEPTCQYFYQCGGCAYQHVTYQLQLRLKKQVVTDALRRIGQQKIAVQDVLGMEKPWQYRNKVTWQVGELKGVKRLGYYQQDSHWHLPINRCWLLSPEITIFSQFLDSSLGFTGILQEKKVVIRQASDDSKLLLIVEGPVDEEGLKSLVKSYPGLESLFIYENRQLKHLFGSKKMNLAIGPRRYQVSPLAFFQVNNQQTRRLYDEVKRMAGDNDANSILDAYCGTGAIAIYVADQYKYVHGVDDFPPSIADAKSNALLNNLSNCTFQAGACERIIPKLKQDFDTVILDPPRAGCHKNLLLALSDKKIPQIIYVSCNPATLARDVKILCESSYKIELVQPVDMFPWTYHVETVVLITRVDK